MNRQLLNLAISATVAATIAGCGLSPLGLKWPATTQAPAPKIRKIPATYGALARELRRLAADELGVEARRIQSKPPLSGQRIGGRAISDDLDVVEIVLRVEETYGVALDEEIAGRAVSSGDAFKAYGKVSLARLTNLVWKKRGQQSAL